MTNWSLFPFLVPFSGSVPFSIDILSSCIFWFSFDLIHCSFLKWTSSYQNLIYWTCAILISSFISSVCNKWNFLQSKQSNRSRTGSEILSSRQTTTTNCLMNLHKMLSTWPKKCGKKTWKSLKAEEPERPTQTQLRLNRMQNARTPSDLVEFSWSFEGFLVHVFSKQSGKSKGKDARVWPHGGGRNEEKDLDYSKPRGDTTDTNGYLHGEEAFNGAAGDETGTTVCALSGFSFLLAIPKWAPPCYTLCFSFKNVLYHEGFDRRGLNNAECLGSNICVCSKQTVCNAAFTIRDLLLTIDWWRLENCMCWNATCFRIRQRLLLVPCRDSSKIWMLRLNSTLRKMKVKRIWLEPTGS